MNTPYKRSVAAVLLLMMTACSTMQPVSQPRAFLESQRPAVVWLSKTNDQTMLALNAPQLVGDSVVGFVEGEYSEIALSQIRSMQAKQYSRGRTTAFVAGAAAIAVGLFFVVSGGHGSNTELDGEDDIGIIRFRR
jgi:hypothetical protein